MASKMDSLVAEIEELERENTRLKRQKQFYRGRLQSVLSAAILGEEEGDQFEEAVDDEDSEDSDSEEEFDEDNEEDNE